MLPKHLRIQLLRNETKRHITAREAQSWLRKLTLWQKRSYKTLLKLPLHSSRMWLFRLLRGLLLIKRLFWQKCENSLTDNKIQLILSTPKASNVQVRTKWSEFSNTFQNISLRIQLCGMSKWSWFGRNVCEVRKHIKKIYFHRLKNTDKKRPFYGKMPEW